MKRFPLSRSRVHRGVLGGAALLLAGSIAGASVAVAQTPAGRVALVRPPAGRVAGMPSGPESAAGGAAVTAGAGTVVQLHQRVVRVSIANYAFRPARLVVSPGTRIIWTNKDGDPHTVTSTKGLWASDALDTDNQFVRVFKKAGTFPYYCAIHPFMHGTIIVKK